MRRVLPVVAVAGVLLFFLYIFGLSRVGLLGPDEPRYAAVGREMALSGDWVTPRLWGEPWFEKPALLYWLIGGGYQLGFNDDLAPRLPVALVSAAFLCFFFLQLRREFGVRPAAFASAILATSAGWLAYGNSALTDGPMSAAFSASMLLCLPWLRSGGRRGLFLAGLLLGVAVLAKGLVPLVLALPLLWVGRRHWSDLGLLAIGCLLVASPWYLACAAQNGEVFWREFLWKHHFERYATGALQHQQPFWYYLPVLAGGLFPWTPLLASLQSTQPKTDSRQLFFLLWAGWGFLFFSLSQNKLPGYLLPLLPALAAGVGIGLDRMGRVRWWLASCALLLSGLPLIAGLLPQALVSGLGQAEVPAQPWWPPMAALALAALCWRWESSGRRAAAVALISISVTVCVLYMKLGVFPELDALASARSIWRQAAVAAQPVCVGDLHRNWLYGLNFYARQELPACPETGPFLRLQRGPASRPVLALVE